MSDRRVTKIGDLQSALLELSAEGRAQSVEFEKLRKLAPDFANKLIWLN